MPWWVGVAVSPARESCHRVRAQCFPGAPERVEPVNGFLVPLPACAPDGLRTFMRHNGPLIHADPTMATLFSDTGPFRGAQRRSTSLYPWCRAIAHPDSLQPL
ncbi:hypothetical protein MN0502_34590 (plasmid) [Arthrobacter sp. MN05-02]|nr:hypothetical protein MN0502_34590 [Arthrobacter sp. MN05-02]